MKQLHYFLVRCGQCEVVRNSPFTTDNVDAIGHGGMCTCVSNHALAQTAPGKGGVQLPSMEGIY